jgi:hypothetical protein
MIEPKVGDLVAIYMKAEFGNQQAASAAFAPTLYEVLAIDERVSVLLETDKKDIGKGIYDFSRGTHKSHKLPIIVLKDVFELVPISQDIIGTCYRGAVIAQPPSPPHQE